MIPTRFSTGFMLTQPHDQMGLNTHPFGHPGAGGSLGFADPDARIGFGYTMNKMGPHILIDPRARVLLEAVYASL
jgi:CubicO group peptidase (beta-lactamase class C family)